LAYYHRGLAKILSGQKDNGCLDLSKAGDLGLAEAYESIRELCNWLNNYFLSACSDGTDDLDVFSLHSSSLEVRSNKRVRLWLFGKCDANCFLIHWLIRELIYKITII